MKVSQAFDVSEYSSDFVSVRRNKKEVTVAMRIPKSNKLITLTTSVYGEALEFAKITERWSYRANNTSFTDTELKKEIADNLSPKVLKQAVGLT